MATTTSFPGFSPTSLVPQEKDPGNEVAATLVNYKGKSFIKLTPGHTQKTL